MANGQGVDIPLEASATVDSSQKVDVSDRVQTIAKIIERLQAGTQEVTPGLSLTNRERLVAAISDFQDIWVWEVNRQGIIEYSNDGSFAITGISGRAMVGKKLAEFVAADPKNIDSPSMVFSGFSVRQGIEWQIIRENGTVSHILSSISPIYYENQDIYGYCGISRDISSYRDSINALRETIRILQQVTKISRHDALNHLTVILGYLHLSGEYVKDPILSEFIQKERAAAESIQHILTGSRDFYTMGLFAPSWFDLEEVIAKASRDPASGQVEVRSSIKGVRIYADSLLEKAFTSLFSFISSQPVFGPVIRIDMMESTGMLVIRCEDTTPGTPISEKNLIFEYGYGGSKSPGLFFTRRILALTGITIRETGEPGQGGIFEIFVPAPGYRSETL